MSVSDNFVTFCNNLRIRPETRVSISDRYKKITRRLNIDYYSSFSDTDHSIQSKIVAMAFSMAAEIERDLISQRTKKALRARRESGMPLGRPKGPGKSKLDAFRPDIEALLANDSTQKFIAIRYKTTEANLHNWMKKREIRRPVLEDSGIPAQDTLKPASHKALRP